MNLAGKVKMFMQLWFALNSCDQNYMVYCNDPKFSDRQVWANSVDPDPFEQSLHLLPFRLHLLDSLLYGRATLFNFRIITAIFHVSKLYSKWTL